MAAPALALQPMVGEDQYQANTDENLGIDDGGSAQEGSDEGSGSSGSTIKPDAPGLGLENILVKDLVPSHLGRGVLIPLKTNLEVCQDHTFVPAYITRAPMKLANDIMK
jgi:hypothetical protein